LTTGFSMISASFVARQLDAIPSASRRKVTGFLIGKCIVVQNVEGRRTSNDRILDDVLDGSFRPLEDEQPRRARFSSEGSTCAEQAAEFVQPNRIPKEVRDRKCGVDFSSDILFHQTCR
jgi:hypothetical protein